MICDLINRNYGVIFKTEFQKNVKFNTKIKVCTRLECTVPE